MLIAAAAGHGIDQLSRYETSLLPPFRAGRLVQYACECGFTTGWLHADNEDLAKGYAMRHFADDLAAQIDDAEAAGGRVLFTLGGDQ